MVMNSQDYFTMTSSTDEADFVVKSKFRGINPWMLSGSECLRLTAIDDELAQEYERVKQVMAKGWPIKFFQHQN